MFNFLKRKKKQTRYTKQRMYKGDTRQVYDSDTDMWVVFYLLSSSDQAECRTLPMEGMNTDMPVDYGDPFVPDEVRAAETDRFSSSKENITHSEQARDIVEKSLAVDYSPSSDYGYSPSESSSNDYSSGGDSGGSFD